MKDFYGTVTVANIDQIAELMRQYLIGKRYTVVHCYEYKQWKPEVRLHQELGGSVDGEDIYVHHHNKSNSQIVICDSYGVGGLSTTRVELGYDPEFKNPYVIFEWARLYASRRGRRTVFFFTRSTRWNK